MSKFTLTFKKEKKSIFVQNGDKSTYVTISGCPIETVNGTYYQMDPITINDKRYHSCFTNGIYMLEVQNYDVRALAWLYELDNSSVIQKFHTAYYDELGDHIWFNSETSEPVLEMNDYRIGNWNGMGYQGQ
jgi:hypothetical protein